MRIVKASCHARRRRQRDAEVVGERLAAVAVRPRHLLGLIDADENGRGGAAGGVAQLAPLGFERRFERRTAGRRQFVAVALGLGPGIEQAVANDAMRLDLAEIGKAARQGLGEIEQRIGTRTERTQRQPRRCLAAQARDDAGLEQRRLAGARRSEDHERSQVAFGAHLAQLFQRLRDLAAAAVEQRGVGVIVAERGEARERRRTQLAVDLESFGIEANATERAGGAQSSLQAAARRSGPLRSRAPDPASGKG